MPTSSLNGLSFFETSEQRFSNLQHLRILRSTFYIFIYEEEQNAKSAKWAPQGKCGVVVDYNDGTIYCVYLHDEAKAICIKGLKIFKNIDKKKYSQVTSYDAIMTPGS